MIKVMIVDDMPIFREYLREAIDWAHYGFEICCEAKNGKEALDLLEVHEPDIVLSDITMPFIDGLELSELLKDKYQNTEVVLITGNSEFEYAKKAVKLGVADYIVKPFEKEELIVTLLKLKDNITKAMEV
ncbi:response regulator [Acidaminobacter sp. JC074]|uniref:response regulator n=1 Tax=Acidaminobacter sp. JC074 TaxID=2530199 RepID=UPI001F0F1D72|nr:response regulator [Acidaminobacter sp. JC074]MCH4886532.1 response regulator [Acidaminobacter sp. JC074]